MKSFSYPHFYNYISSLKEQIELYNKFNFGF